MHKMLIIFAILTLSGCTDIEAWIHDDVDEAFVEQTFSPQQLHQDIDYLLETMEKRHPAFAQYVDKKALLQKAAQLKQEITQGMTRKQAFGLLAQMTPYFNDGHSILFPLLAETTWLKKAGIQTFPFGIKVQNGEMHLLHSYTRASDNTSIPKGSKITAINAHNAADMVAKMSLLSHGETAQLRESMLSLLSYYWLYAVYDVKGDMTLSYVKEGKEKTITLGNQDNWQRAEGESQDYELKILRGGVGYLRIASFDVDGDEDSYEQFVSDAFDELTEKHISKLIIDVRGNTGGQSDAGAEIIQYITDTPVAQASVAIEKLNPDNNGWFGYKGNPGEVKELDVKSDGRIEPADAEKRFKGEVMVLIDRMTYSAGILFATAIQDNQLGLLAGEPTGGFANQTGNLTPFYLLNTKLLMLAPARYIVRPSGDKRKQPVIPDYKLSGDPVSADDEWLKEAVNILTSR